MWQECLLVSDQEHARRHPQEENTGLTVSTHPLIVVKFTPIEDYLMEGITMKIVVEVSGGVVQEVYCDSPDRIEYILVDWDDLKDIGSDKYLSSPQACLSFSALPEETFTAARLSRNGL